MASNVPPVPPPGYVPPPSPLPPGAPAPKKASPLVWILGGCAVLVALVLGVMMLGGLFVAHKLRQAGNHPELAALRLMVAANPDAELVAVDENAGKVTIRSKRTGKTVTLNFEDLKKGKMSIEADGQKVEMEGRGEGDSGSFTIKTDQGTTKFGSGAVKMPAWLPAYGGASVQGFSAQTGEGLAGTFSFKSGDPAERVTGFYKEALEKAGFTVETIQHPGGSLLTGRQGERVATLNVTAEGGGCTVNGTFKDR